MPPTGQKKRARSAPPAARAQAPATPDKEQSTAEHAELEPLPDGKAYDSLDENDGPPEPSADCLVLDEEELLGLDEYAPRYDPYTEPPARRPAMAPAVAPAVAPA